MRINSESWIRFCFWILWLGLFVSQSIIDFGATLLALTALTLLARSASDRQQAWVDIKSSPLSKLFLVWIGVLALGIFVVAPPEAPRWKLILEFRWMIEIGFWVYLLGKIEWEKKDLPWILAAPLIGAVYGLVVFIFDLGVQPPFTIIDRVGGFFDNPIAFAHNMGPITAGLIMGALVLWNAGRKPSWGFLGAVFVLAMSVLFSYTRGIWVGILIAALIVPSVAIPRRGWKLSLAAVLGALALMIVPQIRERVTQVFDPQRSYDSQRMTIWKANWMIFEDHPLLGLGYSENGRRLREYYDKMGVAEGQFESHAHNQYLHFLSGTGALGLLCYLVFLGGLLLLSLRLIRSPSIDPWGKAVAAGLLTAQIIFEVGSFTESNFSIAKNRALLLLLFALLFALKRKTLRFPTES